MNKFYTLLVCMAISWAVVAQTHFPNTFNVEFGVGVNDMSAFSMGGGTSYVFNYWLAVHGRYSYTGAQRVGYNFAEHNIEALAGFSPVSIKERIYLNLNVGMGTKNVTLNGFSTPDIDFNGWKFGFAGDVELEMAFLKYFSGLIRFTGRTYITDPFRYELLGMGGIKVNTRWINDVANRRLLQKY